MITGKKVIALAALVIATGIAGQGARSLAPVTEAASVAPDYAVSRIDAAFDLVAAMPATAPIIMPVAQKGDLLVPPGCAGLADDAQDECMDVAYELESTPNTVVETREGNTSTLVRTRPVRLAGVTGALQ